MDSIRLQLSQCVEKWFEEFCEGDFCQNADRQDWHRLQTLRLRSHHHENSVYNLEQGWLEFQIDLDGITSTRRVHCCQLYKHNGTFFTDNGKYTKDVAERRDATMSPLYSQLRLCFARICCRLLQRRYSSICVSRILLHAQVWAYLDPRAWRNLVPLTIKCASVPYLLE